MPRVDQLQGPVARDEAILAEHGQYARSDPDSFMSQSMAKTVIGLLVGIEVSEGAIRSIDEPAAADVPELAGPAYGTPPIRAVLQMSSGLNFPESCQAGDDIFNLGKALFPPDSPVAVAALSQFNDRRAPAGKRFNYSSADTEVLGLALSRAIKTSVADYFSSRIWQKLGAQADAAWAVDASAPEIAPCCMVATLRDWARLGPAGPGWAWCWPTMASGMASRSFPGNGCLTPPRSIRAAPGGSRPAPGGRWPDGRRRPHRPRTRPCRGRPGH